jgi:hypothetical protein
MQYRFRPPDGDRLHYVDEPDVEVVLSRLPLQLTARLRAVHFTDDGAGGRRLGYTSTRGRREIALCALSASSIGGWILKRQISSDSVIEGWERS